MYTHKEVKISSGWTKITVWVTVALSLLFSPLFFFVTIDPDAHIARKIFCGAAMVFFPPLALYLLMFTCRAKVVDNKLELKIFSGAPYLRH